MHRTDIVTDMIRVTKFGESGFRGGLSAAVAALFGILVGIPTLGAETVTRTLRLADLAISGPTRLTANEGEMFFIPLPTRRFDGEKSSIDLDLLISPAVPTSAIVEISANGMWVASLPLSDPTEHPAQISANLGRVTARQMQEDFLKLEVTLRLPDSEVQISRDWLEIGEESSVTIAFNPDDPDWVSVSRLPFTLSPTCAMAAVAPQSALLYDLALKVHGWLAFERPSVRILPIGAEPEGSAGTDTILLADGTPGAGTPLISVVAGSGADRTIKFEVASGFDVRTAWRTLKALRTMIVPGSTWTALDTVHGPDEALLISTLDIGELDSNLFQPWEGRGVAVRSFQVDTSRFRKSIPSLQLDFTTAHTPLDSEGGGSIAVLANDQIVNVFPVQIGRDRTAISVTLPYYLLEPRSTIEIQFRMRGQGDGAFLFQVLPGAIVRVADAGNAAPPTSLVDAARRYFSRSAYVVILEDEREDFASATAVVRWLQRMNPEALIEPRVSEEPESRVTPLVFFGNSLPGDFRAAPLPVMVDAGTRFLFPDEQSEIRFESDASYGIWQVTNRSSDGAPIIALGKSGPRGGDALRAMSEYAAALPWVGFGDVLIGEAGLPPRQMLTTGISGVGIEPLGRPWYVDIRKWALISVWFAFSGVVFFVFRRTRRSARESAR